MTASPEEFVRAWQESSGTSEVAEKLGMTKEAAASRANNYRRRGVKLKKFRLVLKRHDIAALNKLAVACLKGKGKKKDVKTTPRKKLRTFGSSTRTR